MMGSFGTIRVLVLIALVVYAFIVRKRIKRNKAHKFDHSLDNFQKDKNGLYPWEVNTDDSPENIPKNAKVFKEKDKIRRGRW